MTGMCMGFEDIWKNQWENIDVTIAFSALIQRYVVALAISFCSLAALSGVAHSTDSRESGDNLTEIVVTATKHSELLIDIAASVQAVSGAELQSQGAEVFSDYARSLAGVSFVDRGAGQTQFSIRGITSGVDQDVGPEST